MAMQLPTGSRRKPGSDYQLTAPRRRVRDLSVDNLQQVRFYKPEFLYQDSGAYSQCNAYIKGYN